MLQQNLARLLAAVSAPACSRFSACSKRAAPVFVQHRSATFSLKASAMALRSAISASQGSSSEPPRVDATAAASSIVTADVPRGARRNPGPPELRARWNEDRRPNRGVLDIIGARPSMGMGGGFIAGLDYLPFDLAQLFVRFLHSVSIGVVNTNT